MQHFAGSTEMSFFITSQAIERKEAVHRINLLAGNDQHTTLSGSGPGGVNKPELIVPANDDLFSSGTLGRYSKTLNTVMENRRRQPAESGVAAD